MSTEDKVINNLYKLRKWIEIDIHDDEQRDLYLAIIDRDVTLMKNNKAYEVKSYNIDSYNDTGLSFLGSLQCDLTIDSIKNIEI